MLALYMHGGEAGRAERKGTNMNAVAEEVTRIIWWEMTLYTRRMTLDLISPDAVTICCRVVASSKAKLVIPLATRQAGRCKGAIVGRYQHLKVCKRMSSKPVPPSNEAPWKMDDEDAPVS